MSAFGIYRRQQNLDGPLPTLGLRHCRHIKTDLIIRINTPENPMLETEMGSLWYVMQIYMYIMAGLGSQSLKVENLFLQPVYG